MRPILLACALLCASCGSTTQPAEQGSEQAPDSAPPAPEFDGAALAAEWRPETIALPQDWAPDLPKGTEVLRFAPGMFQEGAEDYWTYAFRVDLAEELDGEAGIANFLELYYDGLLGMVGTGRGYDMGDDPAQVHVGQPKNGVYPIRIELIDGFVTGKPLTLHMDWRGAGKTLRIIASPQPRDHQLWGQLRAIVNVLEPGA